MLPQKIFEKGSLRLNLRPLSATYTELYAHTFYRELIMFISTTCTKFVLLHTYFSKKKLINILYSQFVDLPGLNALLQVVLSQHKLNYNYPTSYC